MPTTNTTPSTDRQRAFARKLAAERPTWQDDLCQVINTLQLPAATIERAFDLCYDESKFVSKAEASNVIDALLATPRPADDRADTNAENGTPHPAAYRPNRYEGTCSICGGIVSPESGRIEKIDGRWATFHVDDECDQTPPEVVAEGHYALPSTGDNDLAFYKVEHGEGRWTGRTFVRLVVGGHPDRNVPRDHVAGILARIAADPDAAARYGREIGRCYRCNRHLTDETSRTLGIGPDCRAK